MHSLNYALLNYGDQYTYLLTTQLESQRLYFMEQIAEAVKDVEAKVR